jgi:hypothetical protein
MVFEVGGCVVGSAAVMATKSERAVSFMFGEGVGIREMVGGGRRTFGFGGLSDQPREMAICSYVIAESE